MIGYAATTTFGITLAGLASAGARESNIIDWTLYKHDDCMLEMNFGISTPTSAVDKAVYIWFHGSADGTTFVSPCTGTDAGITIGTNHNLRGPFSVAVNVGTYWYNVCIPSVASFFGGNMPKKWGVVVENEASGALYATEADFKKFFTPVFVTT